MRQKYATEEDVYKIMYHCKNLMTLGDLGFYETRLFAYRREVVPKGLAPTKIWK